jgi:cytosine/adenosine deaminase-related metal-dependent hydrolase
MSWTDKVGTLEPGKWADVIAVKGDPLQDIRTLQRVEFVMKSGVVYKDEAQPSQVILPKAAGVDPEPGGAQASY